MRHFVVTIAVLVSTGSVLLVTAPFQPVTGVVTKADLRFAADSGVNRVVLRAAGRIEGRTEEIELRARISEQIKGIHVTKGQWVHGGAELVSLDSSQLLAERDLAEAQLQFEQAKRQRLINGARSSEIEIATHEYQSAAALSAGAEKSQLRAIELAKNNAISLEAFDDHTARLNSFRALASAAKARLDNLLLPAREDDMLAADAAVKAAASRLRISLANLDRAEIAAPISGRILSIDGEVGELTGPDIQVPLVVMSDTKHLRVVAEIDEFDSIRVRIGQSCTIKCDAVAGDIAKGRVVVIEPRMTRKRLAGQWAGERIDTYSRRVWIDLDETADLPVGLPVDVYIDASAQDSR